AGSRARVARTGRITAVATCSGNECKRHGGAAEAAPPCMSDPLNPCFLHSRRLLAARQVYRAAMILRRRRGAALVATEGIQRQPQVLKLPARNREVDQRAFLHLVVAAQPVVDLLALDARHLHVDLVLPRIPQAAAV